MCPKSYGLFRKLLILMTTQIANGVRYVRLRKVLERVTGSGVSGKNGFQLVRRNNFKLLVGAIAWLLVGTPPPELRDMTEARALHMLVRDFHYQLGSERLPR